MLKLLFQEVIFDLLPKKPEIKSCLNELAAIEREFGRNIAFPLVKKGVKYNLIDAEKAPHAIRIDRLAPRSIVLLLMLNMAGYYLGTGYYHLYRGVLTSYGLALLQIFNYAVDQLEKNGCRTSAEAAEDRNLINARIKELG